jgi:2-polyprenyl-3-methyl-5-hydroxy-6-metoxy-1,4-benzoquinol methylase
VNSHRCPLCDSGQCIDFCEDKHRRYVQCQRCHLVFVDPRQWLNAEQERAIYDLHQNSPLDPAYRQFLSRLYQPLLARLNPGDQGLDFGCGPGPALSAMFAEAGFAVQLYDIFYYPEPSVLQQHYQFITATEVVEHLHQPGRVIEQLWALLSAGGTLGLMTKLALDKAAFMRWHYKNDQTHVCFFSRQTFAWLAAHLQAELCIVGNDVILLSKAPAA